MASGAWRDERDHLAVLVAAGEMRLCKECGGPTDCRTEGCKTCWDRERNKRPDRRRLNSRLRRERMTRLWEHRLLV